MKTCPDCKETKRLSQFPLRGGSRAGHTSYCKPCQSIRRKASTERTGRSRGTPSVWRKDDPLNLAMADWIRTS